MGLLGAAIRGGQHVAQQAARPSRQAPRAAQIARTAQRPVGVFAQKFGGNQPVQHFRQAARQAQHRAVTSAQKIPAVAVNNRNVARQQAREVPAFRKQFAQSWRAAQRVLPHGQAPKMSVPKLNTLLTGPGTGMVVYGNHPFGAFTDAQHNTIHVSRDLIDQAFQGGKGAAYAKQAPLHEFAHLFQPPHTARAKAEGGAEAFKILASKRLGMKPVVDPSYAKWAGQALKQGSGFVLHGQFKGGQSKPAPKPAHVVAGKVSWFGGPNDNMAGPTTASGASTAVPGIAVYNPKTLGGYWRVHFPNGRAVVLKQTDLGPAPSTGRKLDVLYSALSKAGYTESNFPTDKTVRAEFLGHRRRT